MRINVGLIGFGKHMTSKLIPAINAAKKNPQVIAVCRRKDLEATKQKHNLKYVTTAYKQIVEDPEINTIFIALPDPKLQTEIALLAIAYKKHVFVEKPAALTIAEYDKLIEKSFSENIVTCEGFNLVHIPSLKNIKSLINNQKLKQLDIECGITADSNSNDINEELSNGLNFAFIHAISVLNELLGQADILLINKLNISDNSYEIKIQAMYHHINMSVMLHFHNQSNDGFLFKINYQDNFGNNSIIDATIKNSTHLNEKQLSYALEVQDFFDSIEHSTSCKNSFSNNIGTHKMLAQLTNHIVHLAESSKCISSSPLTLYNNTNPTEQAHGDTRKLSL